MVHVIASTGKIFFQSKQHVDAHTLMRFHHFVKYIVYRIEEHYRANGKECHIEIVANARAKPTVKKPTHQGGCQHKLHDGYIESHNVLRHEQTDTREEYSERNKARCSAAIVGVATHHASRKQLNKEQNDETSERRWRLPKHYFFETNAHNEVYNHRHAREKETARHAFAIEHEEERDIN